MPVADGPGKGSPPGSPTATPPSASDDSAADPGPPAPEGPAIHFENAAVRLGGQPVWSGVDLDVDRGAFVAVLGPNGVGKSTLIKVVLGILPLAEGRVTVLGRNPGASGRQIGYLPQRRSFDANLRIRGVDVVRLGSDGDRWGLPVPGGTRLFASGRQRRQRVAEVIDLVGASDYAHRPIGQLSGGEQQRLLIAQALVRRPSLLLLDEPLDSLDLPNQASVAALISEISQAFGITVLIVAHDVNPIVSYLDEVVYVAHGGAVCGPPDDVITSETLSALYGTAIEVLRTSDGQMVVVGSPEAPAHHADRHTGHTH